MEESDSKICPNCKREIPAVNFTIHTVHCSRNIKVCPVCKEPVPQNELQDHHDKLHKLMPCKQCGESVCGTDLEDHIRDSCGHTIKSCRFCELELPRHELPAHEGYCGVRTEQCPDCKEWVMIKYRQLHLDSNHGFLRLDDDPVPQPKKVPPKTSGNPIRDMLASTSNGLRSVPHNGLRTATGAPRESPRLPGNPGSSVVKNTEATRTDTRLLGNASALTRNGVGGSSGIAGGSIGIRNGTANGGSSFGVPSSSSGVRHPPNANGAAGGSGEARRTLAKRSNDQPQINTAVSSVNKVHKDMATSRGAVKKRPAPKPPSDRKRDLQYYSALQRQQAEERQRQELSAYNASVGLPPVLSPAAKLDKLRKMDAVHNREVEDKDYKNRLQGRVWMNSCDPSTSGHRLGSNSPEDPNVRNELRNLKPMSPAEFMARFELLQLQDAERPAKEDRFSEIKSSLRELRRGLNEVTAPYNSNSTNNHNDRPRHGSASSSPEQLAAELEVALPCEFCGALVPAHDLVQHQTGCRPDLTQMRPRGRASPIADPAPPLPADPYENPVIPCEFCTESLPVYLISEHQERCRRDPNLLFPD